MTSPAKADHRQLRYQVLAVNPLDFYTVPRQGPLEGDILSTHPCHSLAMDAFYAASDVPREDMVILQYAGAVTTILAHSANHPRRATSA